MISSLRLRVVATFLATTACLSPQLAGTVHAAPGSPDLLWQSVDQIPAAPTNGRVEIKAAKFKTFTVDRGRLSGSLSQAPREFTAARAQSAATEITLPAPDGSFARFRVEEVALMEPGLAAKYPGIKTYRGRGIDDPAAQLHLDVNPRTIHAQVLSPNGAWYVDPYWHRDGSLYMSYRKSDLLAGDRRFKCEDDDQGKNSAKRTAAAVSGPVTQNVNTGKMLRTFRLACGTSVTYSEYHGGPTMDVPDILAALVTMNNRVSGIYETELGVRMILVDNQEAIIATLDNPTPYTDTPGDIGTNPAYLDQKIGEENYDIGHVVTTGSGGVAGLGVVCRGFSVTSGGSSKARGTTGINPPVGDAFWVDFVAHEMGHQFGGNHTFDGTGTNCGVNQNESTAYEPGSGTTIQAYAGICGNQNLEEHSDPYFHFASLQEMFGYVTSGVASRSPTTTLQKPAATESGAAPNAAPSSGTLHPTGAEVTWTGTALGGAAADEETCVEGVTCDTYTLTLSGTPADWEDKNARLTFNWEGLADDYDIFVHKGDASGPVVGKSASSDRPEIITLDPASRDVGTGVFTVRVVYFSVVPPAQQYEAVAKVMDVSNPGAAPTCAVVTPTGNNPPTVDGGANYKIPARTAFALTAVNSSDPDGDPITYCWEESDLGPEPKDANQPDDGANPIFRSFLPKLSPTRTFPRWQSLLANETQTRGEKLPTTDRELNFRITARDNIFGGWAMDSMKLDVIDSGKGFAVTSPNTAVTLPGGSTQTITWDVANTKGPAINTTRVNILLSTDARVGPNGEDPAFPIVLAANTPNDGSQEVTLPLVNTSRARIMVQAVGNVYFDISDEDFTITGPVVAPASKLLNISTRLRVGTGDNVMIGGFIVTGAESKNVVLRAIGPSLSSGGSPVAGRLNDPTLELLDSSGKRIAFNDNWKSSDQRQEIEKQNLQPRNDRESAIARTLAPGVYTAIVRGADDSTGIALVEAYDTSRAAKSKLANISTRGLVEAGDNVMIGGFIVGDQSRGIRVVARAIGPSLKPLVPQAMDDPTLEVRDQNGNTIRGNDDWKNSSDRQEIERVGLAPANDAESALVVSLAPAPYTAIVRGKGDTGIGLVEVYHIPAR